MKKIFLICIVLFLIFPSVFAGTSEEEACFKLLDQSVSEDKRFSRNTDIFLSGGLSNVLLNETTGISADFSTYQEFRDNRSVNSKRGNTRFYARRNNIGTIIAGNNWVFSEIVGFGRDSSFEFPFTVKGEKKFGDKYEFPGSSFKEYVVYTHHLAHTGEFLSCGIVRVVPENGRTLSEVPEFLYNTNILKTSNCTSSFEGNPLEQDSKDYYRMKVNVCSVDHNLQDFLKLEVISIAYNNDSKYLNEYDTHRLQVEAMNNSSNNAKGLLGVQDTFRESLRKNTCFKVIHGSGWNLPLRCRGFFKSGIVKYFKHFFSVIPKAQARYDIEELKNDEEYKRIQKIKEEDFIGLVAYENIPYNLYEKIEKIPDDDFKKFLKLAASPSLDSFIQQRKQAGVELSEYEQTFLNCSMSYEQREKNIIYLLKNIDIENFSLDNINYLDKKFGDCIIPFPDKEHIGKIIPKSFKSNQREARKQTESYEETGSKIQELFQKQDQLFKEMTEKKGELLKSFQLGEIGSDLYNSKLAQIQSEYDQKTINLEENFQKQQKINIDNNSDRPLFHKNMVLIILCVLIGIVMLTFAVYLKKNKKLGKK